MKHVYVIIFLFVSLTAQCQNWQWAKQVGSNILQSYDYGQVLSDGINSYLIGRYSGTMYLQTDTITSIGSCGMYVIKYNSNGVEQWVKNFGGDNYATGNVSEVNGSFDSTNNAINLAGSFYGTLILDSGDTLISSSTSNLFIAKMDTSGHFVWGKYIDTDLVEDFGVNVYTSSKGILYMVAEIGDTAVFDNYTLGPGGCLLKFDTDGNCLFARNLYNDPSHSSVRINFDSNEMVLSGNYQSTNFNLDTATLFSNGGRSFFLAKADTNANISWIKEFGNGTVAFIGGVDLDQYGDIYFDGGFQNNITFNTTTLTNTGSDLFIAKYSGVGNLIWVKQMNALNNTGGCLSLKTDIDGNSYITGFFSGSATFGSYIISTTNTTDMFLARYNNTGDCLGVRNFGYAQGVNVVTDFVGNPICAGGFQNTVSIGNNTFTSHGWFDVFIAKCGAITGLGGDNHRVNNNLLIYANPMEGKCTISVPDELLNEAHLVLSIFDSNGKLIQQRELERFEGKVRLNLEAEAKGVYTAVLSSGSKSYSGKIVFE